jgi:hypothetical protein
VSRPFTHGTKHEIERGDALVLFFSDRRTEAKAIEDSGVVWLIIKEDAAKAAWEKVRDVVLTQWIESKPGTRPSAFWKFDSPRSSDSFPLTRRLLSGAGHPACRESGFGIPTCWEGYRSDKPPVFEAEASFLRRHGLLVDGEEARCDFTPVTITDEREFTYRYSRYEIAGVREDELLGGY